MRIKNAEEIKGDELYFNLKFRVKIENKNNFEGQINGQPRKENITCNTEFEWDKKGIPCGRYLKDKDHRTYCYTR